MLVRAIRHNDFDALMSLAKGTGIGVTTLPVNETRLRRRIEASVESCAASTPDERHASFLLAIEDDENGGEVVGICGVEGAVGLDEPWYNYRVGLSVHASRDLNVYRRLDTLFLTNDLTGSSELCSLFLNGNWRRDGNGALLSKSRFLFMAEFPERFNPRVIAEMRGVSDSVGRSPFWESLGRHFFKMDFSEADYLTGIGNKSFIAELMPQHPVYTAFLSDEAQAVIGKVHVNTEPALSMLEAEGFRYNGYVDIFDAGPTIEVQLPEIRAIRDSRIYAANLVDESSGRTWLVSNRRMADYRACLAHAEPTEAGLPLTSAIMKRLAIAPGDSVRAVPLSARSPQAATI